MNDNVLDFKEGLKVQIDKQQESLKQAFFSYLDMRTRTLEEKIEMFLADCEQRVQIVTQNSGKTIEQLMQEWQREHDKNQIITKEKEDEITEEIWKLLKSGYEEHIIMGMLENKFEKDFPEGVSARVYLEKMVDDFHRGIR